MTRSLDFSEIIVLLREWSDARLDLNKHRRIARDCHTGFGSAECGCWCYDTDVSECEDAEVLATAEFAAANNLIAILAKIDAALHNE